MLGSWVGVWSRFRFRASSGGFGGDSGQGGGDTGTGPTTGLLHRDLDAWDVRSRVGSFACRRRLSDNGFMALT
ncbi:hypothetical protein SALBM311S_06920 [Streptomyces alboniger]